MSLEQCHFLLRVLLVFCAGTRRKGKRQCMQRNKSNRFGHKVGSGNSEQFSRLCISGHCTNYCARSWDNPNFNSWLFSLSTNQCCDSFVHFRLKIVTKVSGKKTCSSEGFGNLQSQENPVFQGLWYISFVSESGPEWHSLSEKILINNSDMRRTSSQCSTGRSLGLFLFGIEFSVIGAATNLISQGASDQNASNLGQAANQLKGELQLHQASDREHFQFNLPQTVSRSSLHRTFSMTMKQSFVKWLVS